MLCLWYNFPGLPEVTIRPDRIGTLNLRTSQLYLYKFSNHATGRANRFIITLDCRHGEKLLYSTFQ